MYSIDIRNTSKKFLKKLPKKESDIILNKIYSIKQNPFRFLKKLQGQKLWRLRVLKYRIIINVVLLKNKIIVLTIGHRKNIYDN